MNLETVSALIAIMIALSIATERLVLIIRSPFHRFFNDDKSLKDDSELSKRDNRRRQIRVLLLSFACAIITTGFLAEDVLWNPLANIRIETGESGFSISLLILAVAATGGSSFWKNLNGYTKAARDAKRAVVEG